MAEDRFAGTPLCPVPKEVILSRRIDKLEKAVIIQSIRSVKWKKSWAENDVFELLLRMDHVYEEMYYEEEYDKKYYQLKLFEWEKLDIDVLKKITSIIDENHKNQYS